MNNWVIVELSKDRELNYLFPGFSGVILDTFLLSTVADLVSIDICRRLVVYLVLKFNWCPVFYLQGKICEHFLLLFLSL